MIVEQENMNTVHLVGKIVTIPVVTHEVCDERFYEFSIAVARSSGNEDILPVVASERIFEFLKAKEYIEVYGEIRTRNIFDESGKSKLSITVFAKECGEAVEGIYVNEVSLLGYVCREPMHRITPLGRNVTDILLAVNRRFGKSDYLPCIAWGRNAQYASEFKVGSKVSLVGRIQSRHYQKQTEQGPVDKIAYEISVSRLRIEGDQDAN